MGAQQVVVSNCILAYHLCTCLPYYIMHVRIRIFSTPSY